MTYPSGRVVNFAYATGGGCCNSRLSSVSDGTTSTTLLNSITFNAAGGVLTQTLNPSLTAVSQTFTYNNRLQQTQIQVAAGSTTLMNFSYNYGTSSTNTGRVLSRTDAIQPEHSANYVYDSIYRLSQAAGADASWGIAWTFDTWGNRLTQTPAGLATSKIGSPQIAYTSNRNQAHTYDNAGNTTNDTVHSYAYNAENQQTGMDGGAATYAYDGEGRRMKKVTSSETTYTFYGPGGILCEFSTSTALSSATAAASTDRTLYRTSERTGTAVLFFNTSGTVLENNRTLPYGEAWLADIASANDKKFTTYDRDKESGLDYAMARYYANTMGRFSTVDPADESAVLEFPISWNRYLYTLDDPINHIDPDGLQSCGDTKINGGVFNGRTVSNVMSGKDDYALMAQWLWIERGTILNSDKADLAGYVADLDRIGSAILNMWLVDNEMVSVFDAQGNRMAPLGSFGHRSLKQLILTPNYARDGSGPLFDKNGNMRQAFRNSLNSILKTNIDRGPLIQDVGGSMVNISCEGVFQSIIETSKLLTGSRPRTTGPGNSLILFWNRDDARNPGSFPGNTGNFIGVPPVSAAGHTFWALRTH